jgi:hypothetical protein
MGISVWGFVTSIITANTIVIYIEILFVGRYAYEILYILICYEINNFEVSRNILFVQKLQSSMKGSDPIAKKGEKAANTFLTNRCAVMILCTSNECLRSFEQWGRRFESH